MYFKKIADTSFKNEFCLTNISKIGSGVFSRILMLVYRSGRSNSGVQKNKQAVNNDCS